MTRLIFSGPAALFMPEPGLLRFLERQYDFTAYEVPGFGQDVLFLDYRVAQQADTVLRPGAPLTGADRGFERPFHLEIWEFGPEHMQVELHDTIRKKAAWTLSLTQAGGRTRPNHRAFFQRIAPPAAGRAGVMMTLDRRPVGTAVSRKPAAAMPLVP